MKQPPQYFEPIRLRASQRWDQREQDPENAALWHIVFMSVQSPRHVLSELLQNADDAGATEASVRVENRTFIFSHNGEDFKEDHFASLCRFGYSNKRALHTIGFRGIGFKSTFSLGDNVELYTPTLSVVFNRARFTEPHWVVGTATDQLRTEIRVAIIDDHRQHEVENNLQEWLTSPVSLLFFKNIRRVWIGNNKLHWGSYGPGPVSESEWMALQDDPDQVLLLAQSRLEDFPPDALEEIRQERMLRVDQDTEFPPARVEIVFGAKGRLYVVLPTGVETKLPFACNAPFIQDPARARLKDPEISPTNRWLLQRAGSLAASVMMQWLERPASSVADRSDAYGLLPDVSRNDHSPEGSCATIVAEAFETDIEGKAFLITNTDELKSAGQAVALPEEIFNVWPAEQASTLLDDSSRPSLSRYVSSANKDKLINRNYLGRISKVQVLNTLIAKHLPRPKSWGALLALWAYVAPEIIGYRYFANAGKACVLPVQGQEVLYPAGEIVRLGEKRLLQKESDWDFVAEHLLVLNQNWPRFLAEQRREAEESGSKVLQGDVNAAYAILKSVGLEESSDVSQVIEQVATKFFKKQPITVADCVRIAQIAAKLGSTAGPSFRFVTQDRRIRATESTIVVDRDGTLAALFPETWSAQHLLHADYLTAFESCSGEEWFRWISSGRAGLHTFAPLTQQVQNVGGRTHIEAELERRGFEGKPYYNYVTSDFQIEDWDFEESLWRHWTFLAENDANLWGQLVERIIGQPDMWVKSRSATVSQFATTGNRRALTNDALLPAWILKLRDLPCMPDTRGSYHKPGDLLRRTTATESLMDVEQFIHGRFDTESNRPLLKLLGVRENPTGPHRLLDILRALAKSDTPPAREVEKWYRRLDQMVETCSTTDLATIRHALREDKIILTENAGWATASGVFLASDDDDVPGADVIRPAVRDLALWGKIGIAERPTADLAIKWLKELPSGKALVQDDARRVRALIARHAVRVWNECGHWLNLAGEWSPTESLAYVITMQTLVPWGHLHNWVKEKTAYCQHLSVEVSEAWPFATLVPLAGHIEERFHQNPQTAGHAQSRPWLNQLGIELIRIELDDQAQAARIRDLAANLAETRWQITPDLETTPYIDGVPAGTPRRAEVVWLEKVLYVDNLPNAKLASIVPERLGKTFARADIASALSYCFGRTAAEVTEYLEENFRLEPRKAIVQVADEGNVEGAEAAAKDTGPATVPAPENGPSRDSEPVGNGPKYALPATEPDAKHEPAENIENRLEPADINGEVPAEVDAEDIPSQQQIQTPPKQIKLSIIERFAQSQGFQKDGEGRFFHADGTWIAKTIGDRFPWERRDPNGSIVRYYWPKDHCLERDALELEADIWGLIEKFPTQYSLILSNIQGDPIEVAGVRLRAMRENGELTLHQATYRLVYKDEKGPR